MTEPWERTLQEAERLVDQEERLSTGWSPDQWTSAMRDLMYMRDRYPALQVGGYDAPGLDAAINAINTRLIRMAQQDIE